MGFLREKVTVVSTKKEASYGTNPGGLVPMRASNVSLTPVAGDSLQLEDTLEYYGSRLKRMTNRHSTLSFSVYAAGSGTAGTAPPFADLLLACGMEETVDAGVSVAYSPLTGSEPSASIQCAMDKAIHSLLGSRGTVAVAFAAGQWPMFNFNMTGRYADPAIGVTPTTDWSGWSNPNPVDCQNTPTFTIHGESLALRSFELTQGNSVVADCMPGLNEVVIHDRASVGSVEFLLPDDWTTFNPFTLSDSDTLDELTIVQGLTAGNIVTVTAPKVQLSNPRYGAHNGRRTVQCDLVLLPDTGNDEWLITFT